MAHAPWVLHDSHPTLPQRDLEPSTQSFSMPRPFLSRLGTGGGHPGSCAGARCQILNLRVVRPESRAQG